MEKGCPDGQPFHCRAVIRLNQRKHTVLRRCGPPERLGSSSRMPATAAIDNETLDHLLSVVDDWRNLSGNRELSKPHPTPDRAVMRAGFLDFAHIQLGKKRLAGRAGTGVSGTWPARTASSGAIRSWAAACRRRQL